MSDSTNGCDILTNPSDVNLLPAPVCQILTADTTECVTLGDPNELQQPYAIKEK